jgi:hypothetical protein
MSAIDNIRAEIERMRIQVQRQGKEILQLQRAGISTASADLLLARMHTTIDDLCAQRDRLKAQQHGHSMGKSWEGGGGERTGPASGALGSH